MTTLNSTDIENFWIRVYLNPKEGLLVACADRAYRDLNRTLRGISKEQTKEKYYRLRGHMMKLTQDLISQNFKDQSDFDQSHKLKCDDMIQIFNSQYSDVRMAYGQAQKWINMYLKYLFALGKSRIADIDKNYKYFHLPIDNIIQTELEKFGQIERISGVWSQINDYDVYLGYQDRVRKHFKDSIPMDIEFDLFNKASSS